MRTYALTWKVLAWMLGASACVGAVCGQPSDDLLQRGTQLFKAHDLEQAEAVTRRLLTVEPKSARAMYLLGTILEAEKKPKESLEWFTRAAAMLPPQGEDLRVVAMDYVLLNAYTDALRWLNESVKLDPGNAEAWYDLGRTRMMQGDLHGARQPLLQAQMLKPGQAKVANNLGVVAAGENQPGQAAMLYREAIRLQAKDAHPSEQPLLNLGVLLLQESRPAEALPLLLEAMHDAPRNAKCREELARAEEQQGQRKDAIEQLERAVELEPKSASLHFQLGQMYRRAGLGEKAKAELKLSGNLYGTRSSGDGP